MDLQDQLYQAILFGDIAEIERLLDQGASVDKTIDGQFPICIAISNGETDVALCMLRRGPDLSLPPLIKQKTSTRQVDDIPSWRTNYWVILAGHIMLGVGIRVSIEKVLNHRAVQFPAAQALREILDIHSPLGISIFNLITNMVLPMPSTKYKPSIFRPTVTTATLLGIFGLSRTLREPARGFMTTLLSWKWKGIVFRSLLDFGVIGVVACCQRLRRSIWKQEMPTYPGLKIADSFIHSKFKSERLALALLDHGLFSKKYVKEFVSLASYVPREQRTLTHFWATAASLGMDSVIRRLISLGFSVDVPIFNWMTTNYITALGLAASSWQPCVVETLLDYGANVEGVVPTTHQPISPSTPLIECLLVWGRHDDDRSKAQHQVLELLIKNGADVNTSNSDGETALIIAAQNCSIDTVKFLLKHGAVPSLRDKQGKTAVQYVINRTDAAELLELFGDGNTDLDIPDEDGYTPFLRAASKGETSAVRQLLSQGANPLARTTHGETALQLAARYGSGDLLEMLLEAGVDVNAHDQETDAALFTACCRRVDRVTLLTLLLNAGADPNIPGRLWRPGSTALHEVCRTYSRSLTDPSDRTDQVEAVKLLVQHGADVNARYTDERMADERDVTPLGLAASHAPYKVKADIFKLLLEAGADPAGLNDAGLPALLACAADICGESDDFEIKDPIGVLLDTGVDIATRDENGMSCLHHAAEHNQIRATLSILSRFDHAKKDDIVDTKDGLGRTPLHIVCASTCWMTLEAYNRWSNHQTYGRDYYNWNMSLKSNLVLRALRNCGADPYLSDAYGGTTLHAAAKAGNPRIMAMLLLWTGPGLLYDMGDGRGRLAFHYAVLSIEVTRMLLQYHQHGTVEYEEYFEVVLPDDSLDRSLTHLINTMSEDAIKAIKKRRYKEAHPDFDSDANETPIPWWKAVFNAPDEFGNTPLHYAALAGRADVVELYINMPNIDIAAHNKEGETALDFASDLRCTLAISEKVQHLQPRKAVQQIPTTENSQGENRKEAEQFIKHLGKRSLWGVYRS